MTIEEADSLFQIILLLIGTTIGFVRFLKRNDRRYLLLCFAYASYALGTIYWVLHLAVAGIKPHVFCVADFSWLAAYLFLLSLQILRSVRTKITFAWGPLIIAVLIFTVTVDLTMGSRGIFLCTIYGTVCGSLVYTSIFRIYYSNNSRKLDLWILICLGLQLLMYVASWFTKDYDHFNLYFAVDMLFTLSLVRLLPLVSREVNER